MYENPSDHDAISDDQRLELVEFDIRATKNIQQNLLQKLDIVDGMI